MCGQIISRNSEVGFGALCDHPARPVPEPGLLKSDSKQPLLPNSRAQTAVVRAAKMQRAHCPAIMLCYVKQINIQWRRLSCKRSQHLLRQATCWITNRRSKAKLYTASFTGIKRPTVAVTSYFYSRMPRQVHLLFLFFIFWGIHE